MSLVKNWKTYLGVLSVLMFAACAGSKGGASSSEEGGAQSLNADGTPAAPKEEITEDKLKDAHDEAIKVTEENHELRRQIFEAKTKLGIPIEHADEETESAAGAKK